MEICTTIDAMKILENINRKIRDCERKLNKQRSKVVDEIVILMNVDTNTGSYQT